jgi:hypothetical protein
MATQSQLISLHRYYVWADRQRDDFMARRKRLGSPPIRDDEKFGRWIRMAFDNVAPWLGSLYVVVEGWNELELSDPDVDRLLASPHVDRLRRFRNGVFHFQPKYGDDRFLTMFKKNGVPWAHQLHAAFKCYFTAWDQSRAKIVMMPKRAS